MVSQAVKYASVFAPIISVWILLVLDLYPGGNGFGSTAKQVIIFAPFIAVVLFGIYCLFSLYSQVRSFKDRPDEAEALRKEIEEAKADLRQKGVIPM